MDALGKNDLNIRIQQEKSYHNDEIFFFGFEKVLKMQVSVIKQCVLQFKAKTMKSALVKTHTGRLFL